MEPFIPSTGAHPSHFDERTIQHGLAMASAPTFTTGGVIYDPQDIEMQSKVGICTAISVVQNAEKANGKKYSPDFHWLLQKKYFDKNWYEGSEIFNSLKVAKNYGFLPIENFPYITEDDRQDYNSYIAKLQAIPEATIQKLIGLCVDKIVGYAQLGTDSASIAKGIDDSKTGIICMLQSGSTWWTASDGRISWAAADIDPIRVPTESLSGHAIIASYYDYRTSNLVTYPNTWSSAWDDKNQGNCHIDISKYKMVEAWIPYYELTPIQQQQIQNIQVQVNQAQVTLISILKLFLAWLKK